MILEQKITLMPGVEILENDDNEFFILDKENSRHFRINEDTASILEAINHEPLTGIELLEKLQNEYANNSNNLETMLTDFLQQLLEQRVVNCGVNQVEKTESSISVRRKTPLLKFKKTTELTFLQVKQNPYFLGKNKSNLIATFLLVLLISCFLIYFAFVSSQAYLRYYSITSVLTLMPIIFIHIILHELSHIIVCKKMGGRVKEVGLGLLYYFIPVAFVTYKDTYRLPKLSRAKMAIAGPIFDLSAMSLVSILLILFPSLDNVWIPLLFLQVSFLMFNLNLLLPSDAYRFIESLSKKYNVRRRSFYYVFRVITRRKKLLHQQNLSTKTKVFYYLYTLLSISYIGILFILMISMVRYLFGGGLFL